MKSVHTLLRDRLLARAGIHDNSVLIRFLYWNSVALNSPTLFEAGERLEAYMKQSQRNNVKAAASGWLKGKVQV